MRFRKGSKVEVLSKRDVPSASWFRAEIISGNGRYYNVKYDKDHAMEKVQRKSIRPCPPTTISRSGSWAPCDTVEVFENYSWKAAKIVHVIDNGDYAIVTLVRFSEELKFHRSNIRMRQSWKGNRWVLVDKESGHLNAGNMETSRIGEKFDNRKMHRCTSGNPLKGDNQFRANNNKYVEGHCQISLRGLRKRSHSCLPPLEGDAGTCGRKMGAVKKEGKRQRFTVAHSSEIPEKVDACASSRILPGEKYMGASLKDRTTGFSESGMNWGNPKEDVHFFLGSLEHSESDSHSSSVGSCSPSSSPYSSPDHHDSNPIPDVEVSSCSGREPSEPTREGETAQIHQMELNAYRSIILALYASGPLSWEREALLTNLRIMLHITNDEHLLELRHLNNCQKRSGLA